MDHHSSTSRAGAAAVGFLLGAVGGFLLTDGFAAFCHFMLDYTLDLEETPALLVVFLGVPPLTGVAGALVGLRLARKGR